MSDPEELVRRLLADARVDQPMPAEVADRLDAVLAGLRPESGEATTGTPVTGTPKTGVVLPLRRRWATRVLGAAAAVVLVAGVGVGLRQVIDHQRGTGSGTAATSNLQQQGLTGTDKSSSGGAVRGPQPELGGKLQVLHSSSLRADATRLVAAYQAARKTTSLSLPQATPAPASPAPATPAEATPSSAPVPLSGESTSPSGSTYADQAGDQPSAYALTPAGCHGPALVGALADAGVLTVLFDGRRATVVLPAAPAGATSQLVEVWTCDGTRQLALTVVPLPAP